MDETVGPQDLDHFEDRLLYHLVDLAGSDRPLPVNAMVPEADLHQRMADELSKQIGTQPIDPRSILIEGLQELERYGYADLHKVMGPWGARPTRAGRERTLAWRRLWRKNRDRKTEHAILETLDAQRRERPNKHTVDAQIDVPDLLAQQGISREEYLACAQRLRDQGKIRESTVDQLSLADGWAHITEMGVAALERSNGIPERRGGDAERAWNEVARLKKRIATLVQEPKSLIRDAELAERCSDLLAADANHDRVIREACTVLENRVRRLTGISAESAVPLIQQAFSAKKPVIRMSDHENEQLGAMELYTGMMRLFRNGVGHRLDSSITHSQAEPD